MVYARGIVHAAWHVLLLGVCLLGPSMTWGTEQAQAQVVGQLPPIEITSARGALASSLRTVRTLALQETFGPTAVTTALAGRAGLFLQQTSGGGGTAFIRGFTGKQVVYTFDGIRLNNATYRYGPTQYLTTLDPLFVKDAQVLFGPGSVAYGSDAMGGVLALTSSPVPQGSLRGTIQAEARQATRGGRLAAVASARGFEGGLSWDVDGDRTAGMGPSPVGAAQRGPRQAHTSRNQRAWFARYASRIDRWTVQAMVLETVQRDIPKTNRMVAHDGFDVPDALNEVDLQRLRLLYARAAAPLVGSLRTNLTGYVHQQTERRHVRAAVIDPLRSETDDVWATGGHATVQALPSARAAITVGVSAQYEWIGSWAALTGLPESSAPPQAQERRSARARSVYETRLAGRYPDGSRYSSQGAYVNALWRKSLRLSLEPSIRLSRYRARIPFGGNMASLDARYHDLTFGLGATYRLMGGRRLVGSLSRGFRAPNIDDLAVEGAWDNGVDVPNPNIRPEYVWQLETGLHAPVWNVPLHVTAFVAFYRDLMQRVWIDAGQDGLPNTLDDRYQFDNLSQALTWGIEAQASHAVRYTNGDLLDLRAEGSVLWGASQDEIHEPLRRIPPAQLDLQARFQREAGRFLGRVWLVAPQRRLSDGDRRDTRIPVRGSAGFIRVDAGFSQRLGRRSRVSMDLENLLDVRYRLHGSGLDGAGRSFTIGVNISLGA